jgi:hypothetical protein
METIVYGFLFLLWLARLMGWIVLVPFRVAGRILTSRRRRIGRVWGAA